VHVPGVGLDLVDAGWHILNFLAPALVTALLSSTLAKVLWRSKLRAVPWTRLCAVGTAAAAVALVGGVILTGHDGRMATYAGMVVMTAVSLWWFGFRPFGR
jgi:hypothetical protein